MKDQAPVSDAPVESNDKVASRFGGTKKKAKKKRGGYEPVSLNMLPMMALFTVILCYLLKDYSSDPVQIAPSPDTRLPHSTSKLAPQKAIQVAISQRVILVDNVKVAEVRNGRVSAEYKKDNNRASMYIVPLYEALRKKADRDKLIARYNKKKRELQFKGLLTIIADKRVPFRLLTEVLYTAGQAEYGQYKFAVIKKEGAS